jgi:hypothetical protein
MPDTVADSPLAKQDAAIRRGRQASLARERVRGAAGWWIIGFFWVASLGIIGLTASNFRAIAAAADRVEQAERLAPSNQLARGACAALARVQPPVMFDPDSECWINLTQQQYRDGTIRPHDFPFDNAPYGRARHWSSSFSWWLLALATVAHAVWGLPMVTAIADVAPWANPVLFGIFVTALALVLRRKIGAMAAGMFILTLASMAGAEWDFSSGHPDHHGLHLMAFTGLFLGALLGGLGWVRAAGAEMRNSNTALFPQGAPDVRGARFWLTFSGVCGGIGLWIGSTQQIVCIAALGIGAVLGALLFARRWSAGEEPRFDPGLWRRWSRVGSVVALAFYVLEYFPGHMEMRLEVNHPLIALGWAGAGELMWLIMMAKVDWSGFQMQWRAMLTRTALALCAVAALPLAIILGPRRWFVLGNPMLRLWASLISEGQPWLDPRHPAAALARIWNYTGVLMLAVPLALGVLIWVRMPPLRRSALLTLLIGTGVFLGWTLLQNRWIGFLEISLLILALAALGSLPAGNHGRAQSLILLALLLPGWLGFGLLQARARTEDPARHARFLLEGMMAIKEAAWNLELYSQDGSGSHRPARVMAPPGPSPTLTYYGGVDTVGSYYWENLDGCQATVDFYDDMGNTEARQIARERGLDFVMAVAQPAFVLEMQELKTGRVDLANARRTLAFRLSSPSAAEVPDWLERLPLLDAPMAEANGIRLYRVRHDKL